MADATAGAGGGGGPRMPASPSPSSTTTTSSSSSLDGGFLLRLLQNPPQTQTPTPTLTPPTAAPPTAPGPHFFDPAVAAVVSLADHHRLLPPHHLLFPSPPHFAAASPPQHGGFVWPSPSPPQQSQQHGFPNYFPDASVGGGFRQFSPPLDPYPALGRGFGASDGIVENSSEKPKQKLPPPGFGKPLPAATREVFGKMPQTREQHQQQQNHHLPKFEMPHVRAHERLAKPLPDFHYASTRAFRDPTNHEMLGKMPQSEHQQQGSSHRGKGPLSRWVPAYARQEGCKNKETGRNDLEGLHVEKKDVGITEGDLPGGADGGMRMEVRKLERSYEKSEVRFAGRAGQEEDNFEEEGVISEQLMEAVVLGGGVGDVQNGAERKDSSRSKVKMEPFLFIWSFGFDINL